MSVSGGGSSRESKGKGVLRQDMTQVAGSSRDLFATFTQANPGGFKQDSPELAKSFRVLQQLIDEDDIED